MAIPIVDSDAFTTTLQTPVATESASAPALLSEFLQPVANRTKWLYNKLIAAASGAAVTLTEAGTYDALVQIPGGLPAGDAFSLSAIPLANRTHYLKTQVDSINTILAALTLLVANLSQVFSSTMGGASTVAGGKIPFSGGLVNAGPFVAASGELNFPANGKYFVSAYFELFPSATFAEVVTMNFNGSAYASGAATGGSVSGVTTHYIQTVVDVTAFATDKIAFVPTWGGGVGTQTAQPSSSNVTVRRLS